MPSGQKSITWTQDNVNKLFNAILNIHSIKIDYDAVAKEFGVSGAAIARYLSKCRVRTRNDGQTLDAAPVANLSTARGRTLHAHFFNPQNLAYNTSDDDLDHGKGEGNQTSTPPETPIKAEDDIDKVLHGRVTNRMSPDKNEKKDHMDDLRTRTDNRNLQIRESLAKKTIPRIPIPISSMAPSPPMS